MVKGWYAAFLTFDKDGRVTCDHTYIDTPPFKDLVNEPEMDIAPELKKAIQKIGDSQSAGPACLAPVRSYMETLYSLTVLIDELLDVSACFTFS